MKPVLILFCFFYSFISHAYTVLIDPGHGGKDLGASSRLKKIKVHEKDLVLEISKMIAKELNKKGINAYLTRSMDRKVSLSQRAQLAQKVQADIFISVHANASQIRYSSGFETYYLDNHQDGAVKKIEEVENQGLFKQEDMVQQILTDLVVERTVTSSKKLAYSVHTNLRNSVKKPYKLVDRGIKAGLFYVLALAKRPSILLEVGFLSNAKELKKIQSKKFQKKYAQAVAKGVASYLKREKKVKPKDFLSYH